MHQSHPNIRHLARHLGKQTDRGILLAFPASLTQDLYFFAVLITMVIKAHYREIVCPMLAFTGLS
jgi:hypothetical protein